MTSTSDSGPGFDVAALLADVVRGDAAAWEALVDEYSRMVWSVVRSFGLDHATSCDVTQTVWLRLHEHAAGIREPKALPGWLATTAKRESLRLIKNARREVFSDRDVAVEDPTIQIDEVIELDDRRSRVGQALLELGEACRQLLRLLTLDPPLSYDELAAVLGRPRGSIGPTRRRCLEQLRTRLAVSA